MFYQPSCGIAGDMHLAALVDLGVPEAWLREQLGLLPLTADFQLELSQGQKQGIRGCHAHITTSDTQDHRHYSTIVRLVEDAPLAPPIRERALKMFEAIAQAEGKIHDIPPSDVHFHEVGAVDSIVDIVAAAAAITYLAPELILCNPVEVGSGWVDCAHGRFPVPAPATQELLRGAPCTYGGVQGECTTPTGAAILSTNVDEFSPAGHFQPEKIGYGIGTRDFELPNVLRIALGDYQPAKRANADAISWRPQPGRSSRHFQVEANIDDMSPETYEPLIQGLFDVGAADVFLTPIIMKKGRPAHCLKALCAAEDLTAVTDAILNQSTTIGLRIFAFDKRVLEREEQSIDSRFGPVRIKRVIQPNGHPRWKVEHEDILTISQRLGQDYRSIRGAVERDVAEALDAPPPEDH